MTKKKFLKPVNYEEQHNVVIKNLTNSIYTQRDIDDMDIRCYRRLRFGKKI